MTAAEIVMKRDDPNIAWGFRLTGGADLGTPFYVVKVLGRGHAERAGLRVGDMVYAINHKYVNNCSHKDAQNEILHTGDTLILNIKRGHSEGRGNTPLPDYADPLMGITVPPEIPRPKPVPPPPYQPPPAMMKEPTPPESEDEEAEDTVASFNVKINPRGRIAEIEELPVTPPTSRSPSRARSRSRSMSKDRRRSASAKRDSTAVQNGFVPVQNSFDKNGFQGVQNGFNGIPGPGETFTYSKEVVTQYSTVLSASEQREGDVSEFVNESFVIHGGSTHKMEDILSPEDIERDIFEEKMEEQRLKELLTGEAEVLDHGIVGINFQKIIPRTDFIKDSNVFKKVRFKESIDETKDDRCSIEELKEKTPSEGQKSETQSVQSEKLEVKYQSEFERQLAEIQKQIEAIQQLPSVLQANLMSVQEQLAKIVAAKAAADDKQREVESSSSNLKRDSIRSNLNWKIDVTVEENQDECLESEQHEETPEQSEEQQPTMQLESQDQECEEDKGIELEVDFGELVEHTEVDQFKNIRNQQLSQQEEDLSVRKPPLIRNFPRSAERPIVLPGGRKWYKPQDAYNEDFIAETIIHQSEVLVGTTIGLNFLKYEPPKFDAANSSVFRMIQELEGKSCEGVDCLPIEARPEKVLAGDDYFPPISKRHFFAARLTEQGNENVEKILQDVNEQHIISV